MNWYLDAIKNHYCDFNGRARRKAYWWFVLINVVITVILGIISEIVLKNDILVNIYSLAVLSPFLGLAVRRLHDTNRSGGWILLLQFIPTFLLLFGIVAFSHRNIVVGGTSSGIALIILAWFIMLMATDGDEGANDYGDDPKYD